MHQSDPINMNSLLTEIKLIKEPILSLQKHITNNSERPREIEAQIQFSYSNQLGQLILKHTNTRMFGNASKESIISYGCRRLEHALTLPAINTFYLN